MDRPKRKDEQEAGADFVPCIAFGKTADILDEYFLKGDQAAIQGHIQTGSYVKADGTKVYTTDVVVDRLEFGKQAKREGQDDYRSKEQRERDKAQQIPEGFHAYDDEDEGGDIPF